MLSLEPDRKPLDDLLREVDRQMTICNACRYCEGFCAVFPAMERHRTFETDDLVYMANLCFECRACYYACPYTPPHEYAVNIPEALSSLRLETYRRYTGPRLLSRLLFGNWLLTALTLVAATGAIFALALAFRSGALFSRITGEGAFFEVVPYLAMTIPALLLSAYWLAALGAGAARFWGSAGDRKAGALDWRALARAAGDAFGLVYLKGGGEGCPYPDERPSPARRWFHHLVFYGVLLDFASTTLAAVLHNFFDSSAPYAYLSGPVLLGTLGGVMIVAGVGGLFWLKQRSDRDPAQAEMLSLDVTFLALLLLTSASGLLLLALRDTSAMGTLLVIHLAIVATLFATLPFGKFAHVVYRYAALVRNRLEEARE